MDIERLLQRQPLVQTELTPERHADDGRDRHVSEAAELNERQHHELAEHRQVVGRVDHDQAGDTDRRRGGEECIQKRERITHGRNWQAQENRARGDQRRKTEYQHLRW
jgi:hypothetical protein